MIKNNVQIDGLKIIYNVIEKRQGLQLWFNFVLRLIFKYNFQR
jgi:hypothetical protein